MVNFLIVASDNLVVRRLIGSYWTMYPKKFSVDRFAHFHHFTINTGILYTFDMKCNEIFFKSNNPGQPGQVEVYASLTGIDQAYMFELTGSGITT